MGGERMRLRAPVALMLALAAACTAGGDPGARMSPGEIQGELVSTEDRLPDTFPADFPLPAERTVIYSALSKIGTVVFFDSNTDRDAIRRAIVDGLEAAGWKLHVCQLTPAEPEPLAMIVASKGRRIASAVVGYSAQHAERIDGGRYAFLVSIAEQTAEEPLGSQPPC